MSRRLPWVAALAVVAVLAAVGWVALHDGPTYGHSLERFGKGGVPNHFVDLDDGSQISVGSPDRHRLVVQWKDPEGHGWTSPKTVHADKKNVLVDTTVRYGGSTTAIDAFFTYDTSSESDTDGDDVTVVCVSSSHHCDARKYPKENGSAGEVTSDGRTAFFGIRKKARFWTEDGFHEAPVSVPASLRDAP